MFMYVLFFFLFLFLFCILRTLTNLTSMSFNYKNMLLNNIELQLFIYDAYYISLISMNRVQLIHKLPSCTKKCRIDTHIYFYNRLEHPSQLSYAAVHYEQFQYIASVFQNISVDTPIVKLWITVYYHIPTRLYNLYTTSAVLRPEYRNE
jgi:hypothetical protein